MIWGKTHKEKQKIREEKNNNWFAWFPVQLDDGRWCWWEKVQRIPWTNWASSGYNYYLEQS